MPMVGFKYYAQAGPIFIFFTAMFFLIVPLSFFELYRKIKKTHGDERRQLQGLFFTSLIGYLGGSPTFLPIYGISFPQITLFLLPIYPFVLAYFMIKQKLFDVEEFAQAAHRDKLTAIGVLAASINHEVRNPLFIIKGLAESYLERQKEGVFLSKEKALENASDAMKRSIDQAERAMDIIKRLSLFAKAGIDSEIKFESVKVGQVVDDILPLIRYELAAHNIALIREIPADLPDVRADRRYLEEILFNLLVNAIQAVKPNSPSENPKVNWASPGTLQPEKNRGQGKETGKPGEIRITAQITQKQHPVLREAQHRVLIRVEDTGPGIPEDKMKDVFRPFYTTKAEGTGLGLYITQQLVEKIFGQIHVRSSKGKGTVFSVTLPV